MSNAINSWPELPHDAWSDTCTTLHLWTQVVGKIRLATTPWVNHSWHVPLYVNSRGLTTSAMPHGARTFAMQFDFVDHVLDIDVSDGQHRKFALEPQSVAQFKGKVDAALASLGVPVAIRDFPCEIEGAVPFSQDHAHAAYDPVYAQRFWHVLVQVNRVMQKFRSGFIGKCSPVHFFWGSFDLAVTRFSGRRAPMHPGVAPGLAPIVMQEAYSHEVSSAGFWPGGRGVDALFYSYAYPEPEGFRDSSVPDTASYSEAMGEFVLPYAAVRASSDPDGLLLDFMQSTYAGAADRGKWDRAALECPLGTAGVCRPM
jgi:Family of unknown function (DUF5996)